jgi:hypothetical protein
MACQVYPRSVSTFVINLSQSRAKSDKCVNYVLFPKHPIFCTISLKSTAGCVFAMMADILLSASTVAEDGAMLDPKVSQDLRLLESP